MRRQMSQICADSGLILQTCCASMSSRGATPVGRLSEPSGVWQEARHWVTGLHLTRIGEKVCERVHQSARVLLGT